MNNDDTNKKILGIAVGVGGLLAGKLIKDAVKKPYIDCFLRSCSDFERISKNALKVKGVNAYNVKSFREIVDSLKRHGLISVDEYNSLHSIRRMRNKVTHGNQSALDKNSSTDFSRTLSRISKKIGVK